MVDAYDAAHLTVELLIGKPLQNACRARRKDAVPGGEFYDGCWLVQQEHIVPALRVEVNNLCTLCIQFRTDRVTGHSDMAELSQVLRPQ